MFALHFKTNLFVLLQTVLFNVMERTKSEKDAPGVYLQLIYLLKLNPSVSILVP